MVQVLRQLFPVLTAAVSTASGPDAAVLAHYKTFDAPTLTETSFEEVRQHLLDGRPFVVTDGARGLPMVAWDCDFVRNKFPDSLIRQEGGRSELNTIKMSENWATNSMPYPGSDRYPEGAPRMRPFYWDIAKAWEQERERKWGKSPKKVAKQIVSATQIPYWLPEQSSQEMGHSSEMWFHPKGAGARAHMDPHCKTTVSFCFSGTRKWRMMVPPPEPHPEGYFDGEVYGSRNKARRGEWQPTFEIIAPNGSAVVVYPGMVHETLSTGEECSSSVSQTFEVPTPAAYFRAFWPRFALVGEDVGGCGHVVESLVTFASRTRVKPMAEEAARREGKVFAEKVDSNSDGVISESEVQALRAGRGKAPSVEELLRFHDVDRDSKVTTKEVEDSWTMFATANLRAQQRFGGGRADL
eukprot:TRINITY_DN40297_c0_g1_i1.p1 TRINITY_DN40297_c0_g1~~TRINITY_DN40297_c0_g1_i1.p1  ORF type:complete len:438 (-),score=66.58 TRINITY_DN40297_c0_g1_i1:56-1285(-)